MDPLVTTPPVPAPAPARTRGLRWNRIVVGLLLAAAGAAWLLDGAGVDVPRRLAPAVTLIVVGAALLLSLLGGTGRVDLVVIGVVALLLAIAVRVGADRYTGAMGDRTIAPARDGWPGVVRLTAGTVVVDLTGGPLPPGRLDLAVGAGDVALRLPADTAVRADARVVTGTITVDDEDVHEGVDLRWSHDGGADPVATVLVDIGAGTLEVDRVDG